MTSAGVPDRIPFGEDRPRAADLGLEAAAPHEIDRVARLVLGGQLELGPGRSVEHEPVGEDAAAGDPGRQRFERDAVVPPDGVALLAGDLRDLRALLGLDEVGGLLPEGARDAHQGADRRRGAAALDLGEVRGG